MFSIGWKTLGSENMLLIFLGKKTIPDSALVMHLTIPYYRFILRLKTASSKEKTMVKETMVFFRYLKSLSALGTSMHRKI